MRYTNIGLTEIQWEKYESARAQHTARHWL